MIDGKLVRRLRRERKLTQSACSELVDVSIETLKRIEHNENHDYKYKTIYKIARFFEVKIDDWEDEYNVNTTDNKRKYN